jgi:uncharacterized membrane protein YoaK (UPF0700 family)
MIRRRSAALVVLALGSGATDAFAFVTLAGIFTANMTGNLVLIGLVHRPDYRHTLVAGLVALAAFTGSAYAGFRATARADVAPRVVLVAALGFQLAILAGWMLDGRSPGTDVRVVLVALSAAAMGLQTVVGRRVATAPGVTTTFVTGTLVSLIQDVAEGRPDGRSTRAGVVVALSAGALAGAFAIGWHRWLGPVVPVALVLGALPLLGER